MQALYVMSRVFRKTEHAHRDDTDQAFLSSFLIQQVVTQQFNTLDNVR